MLLIKHQQLAVLLLPWLLTSTAFTPLLRVNRGRLEHQFRRTVAVRPLQAAGEAPPYNKIDAVLKDTQVLGDGNVLLHVETSNTANNNNNKAIKVDYQPGHVIALELEDTTLEDDDDEDSKLKEDTQRNGGWMRGPYTITRATENSFDVLIRVVGKKSKAFAEAPVNTPVRFGGKFKVPILQGIDTSSSSSSSSSTTKQVVLISTGVGVGPCVGAIEMALKKKEELNFPPILLLPSYRTRQEVVYQEYLDKLSHQHPSQFQWQPIITSEMGRLSSSPEHLEILSDKLKGFSIQDTHYHLIGNGQMVNEWKSGLEKAGVPATQVTIEQYFNHKADVDERAIDNIASAVSSACSVEAS